MAAGARLTTVEAVHEAGSWLFTVRDRYGELDEAMLLPCEDGVEGWINRCTHQAQRFDRGFGAAVRDGQLVCPKHGSMFDTCAGHCHNGEAAGTTLPSVGVTIEDGAVYLTDDDLTFEHEGGIDDGPAGNDGDAGDDDDSDDGTDGPASTSHIGF